MTYRRFTGCLHPFERPLALLEPGVSMSDIARNASAQMYAAIGSVVWADGQAHAIRKVGIRFGSITVGTGTTTVRVGLRDVLGSGDAVPFRPDANVDESWSAAITALTQNTINLAQLDADRAAVAQGSLLAVVVDFTAFGTSPSLGIGFWGTPGGSATWSHRVGCLTSADSGTTWVASARVPIVIFESDGGVFGTFGGTLPCTGFNTVAFDSGSTDLEQGLEEVAEHTIKVAGINMIGYAAEAGANFDLKIYEGVNVIETVSVLYEHHVANNTRLIGPFYFSQDLTLTRGTTYRAMIAPTSALDCRIMYVDLLAAGHRSTLWGTQQAFVTKRVAGFQAPTTTRVPMAWWIPAGADDGVAAGASKITPWM